MFKMEHRGKVEIKVHLEEVMKKAFRAKVNVIPGSWRSEKGNDHVDLT